jgi:hypothetical protein
VIAAHPGQARNPEGDPPVPGGMSMVVRKDFCATDCGRLGEWVSSATARSGRSAAPPRFAADAGKQFTYVASLGITTPDTLKADPGQRREVAELAKQTSPSSTRAGQKEIHDSEHVKARSSPPISRRA